MNPETHTPKQQHNTTKQHNDNPTPLEVAFHFELHITKLIVLNYPNNLSFSCRKVSFDTEFCNELLRFHFSAIDFAKMLGLRVCSDRADLRCAMEKCEKCMRV